MMTRRDPIVLKLSPLLVTLLAACIDDPRTVGQVANGVSAGGSAGTQATAPLAVGASAGRENARETDARSGTAGTSARDGSTNAAGAPLGVSTAAGAAGAPAPSIDMTAIGMCSPVSPRCGVKVGDEHPCNGTLMLGDLPLVGVGELAYSIATGDFNHDGYPDLAVGASDLYTAMGRGNGTFTKPVKYPIGAAAMNVVAFDMNRDKVLDLVVSSRREPALSVFLGRIDGTFADAIAVAVPNPVGDIAIGDLNADGLPDAAVVYALTNLAQVYLGQGDGTLVQGEQYSFPTRVDLLTLGDLDGDSVTDLAIASGAASAMQLLRGVGDGRFSAMGEIPLFAAADNYGVSLTDLALGDFNHDGRGDLVLCDFNRDSIGVVLSAPDGTWSPQVDYPAATGNKYVTLGDLNHDDQLDLIATAPSSIVQNYGVATALLGHADGTFSSTVVLPPGAQPTSSAIADFNADGTQDLALIVTNSHARPQGAGIDAVEILLGQRDGGFVTRQAIDAPRLGRSALGDLNRDGQLDIVATDTKGVVTVTLGSEQNAFGSLAEYPTGKYPQRLALGDVNGDGNLDVVTTGQFDSTMSVLLGTGTGELQPYQDYPTEVAGNTLALGDFDEDGRADVVIGSAGSFGANVFLAAPGGAFAASSNYPLDDGSNYSQSLQLSVADMNRDGHWDVVAAYNAQIDTQEILRVGILEGVGDGTFRQSRHYDVSIDPSAPTGVVIADFDHNGWQDVLATTYSSNFGVSMLLGQNGSFSLGPTVQTRGYPAVGDVNGDGNLDLVTTQDYTYAAAVAFGLDDLTLSEPVYYAAGDSMTVPNLVDLDHDGRLDIVVGDTILRNRCGK